MYNRNELRRKINQRWIQLVEIGVLILVMNPPILDVWFRLLQKRNEQDVYDDTVSKLLHIVIWYIFYDPPLCKLAA